MVIPFGKRTICNPTRHAQHPHSERAPRIHILRCETQGSFRASFDTMRRDGETIELVQGSYQRYLAFLFSRMLVTKDVRRVPRSEGRLCCVVDLCEREYALLNFTRNTDKGLEDQP